MAKRKKPADFQPKNRLKRVQIQVPDGTLPYYYYRRAGFPSIALPRPETVEYTMDEAFMDAWRDLEAQAIAPSREETIKPGTFNALIRDYMASPEFKQLAERTRKDYRSRGLDIVGKKWGNKRVTRIQRHHVLALRDKYAATPRTSKYIVQVLRKLLAWGLDHRYGTTNPADRVPALKQGEGYKAWTETDVVSFLQSCPDVEMRRAVFVGLYTGQRVSDVIAMTWADYEGDYIHVKQAKTDTKLAIRVHEELKEELDLIPRKVVHVLAKPGSKHSKSPARIKTHILTNKKGTPFTLNNFVRRFREACDKAGFPDHSFHGLRKLATSRLLTAGCSKDLVRAITGHKTDAMVDHYDAQSATTQRQRGTAAILKLPRIQGGEE